MAKKAIIAMSGGVDSSVSAYLMKRDGYECIGATMKLYDNEDIGEKKTNTCCSLDDVADARSVAQRLDMPYYVFNFTDRFRGEVIDRFIAAYEAGHTPNPCIDCNRYMKFDKLYRRMQELEADYIVTGHYVRTARGENGRYLLKKAVDESKDQSYVLYMLTQEQLAHAIFPLGGLEKTEVRKIAEENGFINAHKHDSQDICFVPDGCYAAFIERMTGKTYPDGDFIDTAGRVLGRHKGIINYTIGQRKGLGISADRPLYVCNIDTVGNTVTLGDNADLMRDELIADNVNLISVDKIETPMRVKAKIRYNQKEQPATAWQESDGRLHIKFDLPQRAITLGQAAVLYDGENVVGGGTIAEIL